MKKIIIIALASPIALYLLIISFSILSWQVSKKPTFMSSGEFCLSEDELSPADTSYSKLFGKTCTCCGFYTSPTFTDKLEDGVIALTKSIISD